MSLPVWQRHSISKWENKLLHWPELRFDSQVFLLQILQTPAGFVEGGVLLTSSRTDTRSVWRDRHHINILSFKNTVSCLSLRVQRARPSGDRDLQIPCMTDCKTFSQYKIHYLKKTYFCKCGRADFTPTWLASSVPTKLKINSWIPWWTYICNNKKKTQRTFYFKQQQLQESHNPESAKRERTDLKREFNLLSLTTSEILIQQKHLWLDQLTLVSDTQETSRISLISWIFLLCSERDELHEHFLSRCQEITNNFTSVWNKASSSHD